MSIEAVTEVSKLLAIVITPIVALIGIWKTLASIRLKIEAETRLKKTSEVEAQISLLELFSKLMDVAHGRGDSHFSETIAAQIASSPDTQKNYLEASIAHPVGLASQDAAIAAIGSLAMQHAILREPAIQGLRVLKTFKPNAGTYLDEIENKNG